MCGVFGRGNIGIAIRVQNAVTGLQMAFTAVLLFGVRSALLDMGAKMPPAGRRTAHKRREAAGGYRDMGKIKPAPEKPRAGASGIQDFFAVSQITINGRSRINRIIKRGSPPL